MENNTITPTPRPQPQASNSTMPTFGVGTAASAANSSAAAPQPAPRTNTQPVFRTPTSAPATPVTPAPQPSPLYPSPTPQPMPSGNLNAVSPAVAAALADSVKPAGNAAGNPTGTQSTSTATVPSAPAAVAPAANPAASTQATAAPVSPTSAAATQTPANPTPPASATSTQTSAASVRPSPAPSAANTSAPTMSVQTVATPTTSAQATSTQSAATQTPATAGQAPATSAGSTQDPVVQTSAASTQNQAASSSPISADQTTIERPQLNLKPTSRPPINRGRVIALIAIIAGLLVAGIVAAVIIGIVAGQKTPSGIANAALQHLSDPAYTPSAVNGDFTIKDSEGDTASAAFILADNTLYLSYSGISTLVNNYIDFGGNTDDSTADANAAARVYLSVLSGLIGYAEDEWWQIPLDDASIDLGSVYRAHPFLVLARADARGYALRIDPATFLDFLGAFDVNLPEELEEADDDDVLLTYDGSLSALVPSVDRNGAMSALASLPEISAKIDPEERFTKLTANLSGDISINANIGFEYNDTATIPEEYRPIADFFAELMQITPEEIDEEETQAQGQE